MPETIPRPSIEELQCPGCGHKDSFRIEVSEILLIFPDYRELCREGEGQWGKYSRCACPDCRYQGQVKDFQPSELNKETARG
jgi:hypothetical protein